MVLKQLLIHHHPTSQLNHSILNNLSFYLHEWYAYITTVGCYKVYCAVLQINFTMLPSPKTWTILEYLSHLYIHSCTLIWLWRCCSPRKTHVSCPIVKIKWDVTNFYMEEWSSNLSRMANTRFPDLPIHSWEVSPLSLSLSLWLETKLSLTFPKQGQNPILSVLSYTRISHAYDILNICILCIYLD